MPGVVKEEHAFLKLICVNPRERGKKQQKVLFLDPTDEAVN